jgi:hypothetical protein
MKATEVQKDRTERIWKFSLLQPLLLFYGKADNSLFETKLFIFNTSRNAGVARDYIRNELEKLIMALYKNNYNLQRILPPEKAPGTHSIGGRVGPRTGPDGVETIIILPLPGSQPRLSSRYPPPPRDATDTGVLRIECTSPHIYFSLDFLFNCLIYACLLLTT